MHNQINKSIIRYFSVFMLVVFLLTAAGCGGNGQESTPTTTQSVTDSTVTTTQVDVNDTESVDGAVISETNESNVSAETSVAEGVADEAGQTDINGIRLPSVEEQVLLNESGITIKALGMQNNPTLGACLILSIENQSDWNIQVSCASLVVNNLMLDESTCFIYQSVARGETLETLLYQDTKSITSAGISNIGELGIVFLITDSESYNILLKSDVIPLQTSDFEKMDEDLDLIKDAVSVFDQEGVRVSFCGTSSDEKNKIIHLLIENNSEIETETVFDSYRINDKALEDQHFHHTLPGTRYMVEVVLSDVDLEEIGVSGDIVTFGFDVDILKNYTMEVIVEDAKVDFPVA
ncbi:MAG TPA: hypothetical protein GXZ67_08985 [Clostridiaceae bacterium]|nr:hypothetical protein [Clostridiaceae bacterium]